MLSKVGDVIINEDFGDRSRSGEKLQDSPLYAAIIRPEVSQEVLAPSRNGFLRKNRERQAKGLVPGFQVGSQRSPQQGHRQERTPLQRNPDCQR